jgi:hypothetical protein
MFATMHVSWDIANSEETGNVRFLSGQKLYMLVITFRADLELIQKTPDSVTFDGDSVWSLKQM